MSMFAEYDKVTRQARRILSAVDRPPDAAHLSYMEIPPGTPEIRLPSTIEHLTEEISKVPPPNRPSKSPEIKTERPLIEKV